MKSGNIYSVNDKAMSDALNQSKVTKSDVIDLFYSRGMIVSQESRRRDLAEYFSTFIHDYHDYVKLSNILGVHNRREKSTVSYLDSSELDIEAMEKAANRLNDKIGDLDANAKVTRHKGSLDINLSYRIINFNKSEFRQVEDREATISITKENGKVCLRGPYADTVMRVQDILVDTLKDSFEEEFSVESINMEGVNDPDKRTEFFKNLVYGMEGLVHYDVTDVYIYNPKNIKNDEWAEDENEEEEDTVDLGVHISKASLKGEKVLQSEELQGLYDKGFYIWKIVWQAKEQYYDSDIYEFEAQFSEPERFCGFSYLPRGFYRYKEGGAHNVSKTGFSRQQEKYLGKKIEAAAAESIEKIMESLGEGVTNEED